MNSPKRISLSGRSIELRPITLEHADHLYELGREPSIWDYLACQPFGSPADARSWIDSMLDRYEKSGEVCFVVWDQSSARISGSTSLLSPNLQHHGIEIGWTWYGIDFQRTHVNTDAKRTLLAHCFEDLGAIRVQLKTDVRNVRSQNAISRLGAQREGVLRSHMIYPNGFVRDTAMYSITKPEWPATRNRLDNLLTTAERRS